ncbi:Omega-hydroxypalmitate O-feruloyl transferase [Linum grandiflorum]
MVRPARDTPKGMHFLSNLDYSDMIIYTFFPYKHSKGNEDAAKVIKDALSEVLVHYYPLAGRLGVDDENGGRFAVDCTGEGAVFVEADADCELGKIDLSKPDHVTRSKLVYMIAGAKSTVEIPPLMIQVTRFICGGFVLGMSWNHYLGDGIAAIEFVNSWAETARGLPLSVPPFLDRTLLKARVPLSIDYHHSEYDDLKDISSNEFQNEPIVFEYAHFTEAKICKIRQRVLYEGLVTSCSTFEAVVAFVWQARIKALKMVPDQETRLMLVVNARDRLDPPLPKGYFGNAVKMMTAGTWMARDILDLPLCYAVKKIQDGIANCGDEVIRSTIDYMESTRVATRPLGSTMIATAWYRLPTDSADFGWGGPLAFEPVESPQYESITFLAHHKEMKSLNAFIGLPISAMKTFQELVTQI